MRELISLVACLFLFLIGPVCVHAQIPTPPPGYDQGPWYSPKSPEVKDGHLIIQLTPKAKKRAIRKFRKARGRNPSERQLRRQIAKEFGLRISRPIGTDNVVHATGVRNDTTKIQKAIDGGLATIVDRNYKIYRFEFDSFLDDFFCFLTLCWGLDNYGGFYGNGATDIDVDATDAWKITEGEGVVVGIIDTGITFSHPDLTANIWTNPNEIENGEDDDGNGFIDDIHGWDFLNDDNDPSDDNLHGTHVAGIIAALRANKHGIIGVAPQAKILPLKVLGSDGSGDTAGLLAAIDYAITLKKSGVPLRILNASLGGGETTETMKEALKRANSAGILFVAAAGNDGHDNDETPTYPASYGAELENVLSVASIEATGEISVFSNFGEKSVHLAAPGGNVWSTIIYNLYLPASGTSMAAPHAAGVAALVASKFPNLSPVELRDRLMNSTKPVPGLRGLMQSPGVVSATKALGGRDNK